MRIAFGLALLGAASVFACGSSSSSSNGSAGSAGVNSTAGSSNSDGGTDSNGGTSGSSGSGGDIGEAGMAPIVSAATPHTAGGLVSGGVVAHSAHFTGIFSLGASPGGNGVLTSRTKQLRGGVVGASQK